MTLRLQTVLLNLAVLTASLIQLLRGYRPLIVIVCGLAFLAAGNAFLYLLGSPARRLRREQKRDFYAN